MTTGSLVKGAVDGLAKGFDQVDMMYVGGNPSGLLTVGVGSTVAFDTDNRKYYMYKSSTTWIELGSVEFS